ncbi:universal stress protein [Promineifilum sp.]|uniref:universal stress protein n=1 Tax=Promineifilum sp. TaxID=2664178 RepID=UPI0035AF18BF
MTRLKRFLVPLDGSPLAECALPVARELARRTKGSLVLLRSPEYVEAQLPSAVEFSMYLPQGRDLTDYYHNVREETEHYLAGVAKRVGADVAVETLVEEGERAGAIVDAAADENIDLIVMTTHGRTGLSRWVMGSVAERVLHEAPCPVLILRSGHACAGDSQKAASALRSILIPLDGSPLAEEVLPMGLALAEALDGAVTLLRVQPPDPSDGYLESVTARYGDLDVRLRAETLIRADTGSSAVAQAILDYAEQNDVGLIAMSTHGRSGLQRWVYGSVTQKLVGHSNRAMLVVRPTTG